jgi:hypothetical protein
MTAANVNSLIIFGRTFSFASGVSGRTGSSLMIVPPFSRVDRFDYFSISQTRSDRSRILLTVPIQSET